MAAPKRLTLFDCIAIGVNGIVGSGIFLLPNWVASGAQGFGPLAFLACGALCALVALCYAEVGGMFERSGGTYLYAREALGDGIGFGVGWMVLVSAVLGYASVARGLGDEVARTLGAPSWAAAPIAASLIVGLGLANWRGVKTGARTSDVLTVAKVSALVLFVLAGLFFVRADAFARLGVPTLSGFAEGTFSALFALSGFEFVAVVAGQTENPRRNIPLAVVGSLLGAVVLYALIQSVVSGVLPDVRTSKAALVEASGMMGGKGAAMAMGAVAIVSMVGFCSGSALVGPQLAAALARDGLLPSGLARVHPTREAPERAIVLITASAVAGVLLLDFKALADLTIVTLFCQYVPTCLAVIVFRRWQPDARRVFRVPFGSAIPLAALAMMGFLVTRIGARALATSAAILLAGGVVLLVQRAARARGAPRCEGTPGGRADAR
ncbi:MAG: APC family permease [Myxococcales bacterium]